MNSISKYKPLENIKKIEKAIHRYKEDLCTKKLRDIEKKITKENIESLYFILHNHKKMLISY